MEPDRLIAFLAAAVGISLSGVFAPGPMTAATLAAGTRSKHAGAMIALGHAAIEVPLMLIIVMGAGQLFRYEGVKIGIGLSGGAILLLMGIQLLLAVGTPTEETKSSKQRHPFWTGFLLSVANPYFLIWWATVGLALATQAVELGMLAFVLFAVVHWLCDLIWLEVLSQASHKGKEVFGDRIQRIVLVVCGVLLLFFGGKFLLDAGQALLG
jgi:threonine/homoserine/homoserine lactone efflux protein